MEDTDQMTPALFTQEIRRLVETLKGPALHRAVDTLMCRAMREEGYGEGVEIFMQAVEGYHDDSAPR